MQYAIVVAQFNKEITAGLLRGALKAFAELKIKKSQVKVVRVPGSWEIPFAVNLLARQKKYAALVTLGAVIKGETTHDFWINHAVFPALQESSEKYNLPITLGIVTTNTWKQAQARSRDNKDNRGYAAAKAAIEMAQLSWGMKHKA